MAKKTCPLASRNEFREHAKPKTVSFDGHSLTVETKEFSTDSLGWYLSQQVALDLGGKRVPVMVGLTITVIGSKELPKDAMPSLTDLQGTGSLPGHNPLIR